MKAGLLDGAIKAYTNALSVHCEDPKLDAIVRLQQAA